MPKKSINSNKSLILLSGGMDSTIALYDAINKNKKIEAIFFNYNQKHIIEKKYAFNTCKKNNISIKEIDIKNLLSGSSLLNIEDLNSSHPINNSISSSFLPCRNLLFISIAANYAYMNNFSEIILSPTKDDYANYPDCRESFFQHLEKTLFLGLEKNICLSTPFINNYKSELWKLASDLNILDIIIEETLTDYLGSEKLNEWGRGELNNPASILRSKSYYEAVSNKWI